MVLGELLTLTFVLDFVRTVFGRDGNRLYVAVDAGTGPGGVLAV